MHLKSQKFFWGASPPRPPLKSNFTYKNCNQIRKMHLKSPKTFGGSAPSPPRKTISHIKSPSKIEIAFSMELVPLKTQYEMSKSHDKYTVKSLIFGSSKKDNQNQIFKISDRTPLFDPHYKIN